MMQTGKSIEGAKKNCSHIEQKWALVESNTPKILMFNKSKSEENKSS